MYNSSKGGDDAVNFATFEEKRNNFQKTLKQLCQNRGDVFVMAKVLQVSISTIYGWKSDDSKRGVPEKSVDIMWKRLQRWMESKADGEEDMQIKIEDGVVTGVEKDQILKIIEEIANKRSNILKGIEEYETEITRLRAEDAKLEITVNTLRELR